MFFVFSFSLFNSILLVDALDALVLGVERGSDVGLGLVRHAHPLQGELAALDEVVVHLVRETNGEKGRSYSQGRSPEGRSVVNALVSTAENAEFACQPVPAAPSVRRHY